MKTTATWMTAPT
uniref:Uncharacterized protein n=1 Tax=Arundo donax TaxID=35708 RepID=A0A0A8YE11_ARUDO